MIVRVLESVIGAPICFIHPFIFRLPEKRRRANVARCRIVPEQHASPRVVVQELGDDEANNSRVVSDGPRIQLLLQSPISCIDQVYIQAIGLDTILLYKVMSRHHLVLPTLLCTEPSTSFARA